MSQFPAVNVIDTTSPTTAQLLGLTVGNLNAAADRQTQLANTALQIQGSKDVAALEQQGRERLAEVENQRYREYQDFQRGQQAEEIAARERENEASRRFTEDQAKLLDQLERRRMSDSYRLLANMTRGTLDTAQKQAEDQQTTQKEIDDAQSRLLKLQAAKAAMDANDLSLVTQMQSNVEALSAAEAARRVEIINKTAGIFAPATLGPVTDKVAKSAVAGKSVIGRIVDTVYPFIPGANPTLTTAISNAKSDRKIGGETFSPEGDGHPEVIVADSIMRGVIENARYFDGENAGRKNDAVRKVLSAAFALEAVSSVEESGSPQVTQLQEGMRAALQEAQAAGVTRSELHAIVTSLSEQASEQRKSKALSTAEKAASGKSTNANRTKVVDGAYAIIERLPIAAQAGGLAYTPMDPKKVKEAVDEVSVVLRGSMTFDQFYAGPGRNLPPQVRDEIEQAYERRQRARAMEFVDLGLDPNLDIEAERQFQNDRVSSLREGLAERQRAREREAAVTEANILSDYADELNVFDQ